jgi:alkanesulfonate monooxygenase SsuD/methylene tetrahydromethanopterin reductase-like flavin-dependent oxidoreductase (luciferase family)
MDIGIGLPTTVPDASGPALLEWASRAERYGFASLGTLDRLVYRNYESLITLGAAAAVTERIKLMTTILLAAYRPSVALLAKQLATVDQFANGRLVLGVAAGGREDDFNAAGTPYAGRGRRLDQMLVELGEVWSGGGPVPGIGPAPVKSNLPLIVGGHSPAAMRRAAKVADGWIAGGSSAAGYAALVSQARTEWIAAGRADRPRMHSLAYVSLGPDGQQRAETYLRAYYAFIGVKAERAAAGVITAPEQLRELVDSYGEAGCDELLLFPCTAEISELDRIAEAVGQ